MKALAVIVNIFFPGVGTLIIGKIGQGITQLLLYWFGVLLCFIPLVGWIVGAPLCFAMWIWAIVSAASSPPQPIQVIVTNQGGS